MAHFAKLGVGNNVESVVVVSNDIATTEQAGIDFLNNLYNSNDVWVQTSYNRNFRTNFAGKGYHYDDERDVFIPPQPYPSWVLNEDNYSWEPPIPYPDDASHDNPYGWNEAAYQADNTQGWDLVPEVTP